VKTKRRTRVGRRDIAGMRFGRLCAEVIARSTRGETYWLCLCDCGTRKEVRADRLVRGATRSCGCLRRDSARKSNALSHGLCKTGAYRSYQAARTRCTNPKHVAWPRYGGRGIEFRFTSFEEFLECIGPRPEGKTLDRIRVNGHYEAGNVRWSGRRTQANNRRPRRKKVGIIGDLSASAPSMP